MRLIDADVAQSIADKELFIDEAGTVQFVLAHTPTIDPENLRKKGEWIEHDIFICNSAGEPVVKTGTVFVCSECGREEDYKEPFCHCGADMRPKEAHNGC